jgi:hypothetical protein
MISTYIKLSSLLFLLFFSTSVLADTAFIYYKNSGDYNTSSQYTNLKSELEDLGYTVSSSTFPFDRTCR